jgi:hypothetical protein
MADPLTFLTALVCAAICWRLISFRRNDARHRVGVSLVAWVLAAATGCQAIASTLGMYRVESPFVLVILLVVCTLVFRARGNLASIMRIDWAPSWNGNDRRRGAK